MTEQEYRKLFNFSWNEKDIRGAYLRDQYQDLDLFFMLQLDFMISKAKAEYGAKAGQFKVYDFTLYKHSDNSYHYLGRAGDGAFRGLDLTESFIMAQYAQFTGIGIYPDTTPGQIIHVDNRNYKHTLMWVKEAGKEYNYSLSYLSRKLAELKEAA